MTENCNRDLLLGYLAEDLDLEEQLDFLLHVDTCSRCRREIYDARKAQHPHFYKAITRKGKKRVIADMDDEIFEVA
jgi:hypothetical protein